MKKIIALVIIVIAGLVMLIPDAKIIVVGHIDDIQSRLIADRISGGEVLKSGSFNKDARGSDALHNGSGNVTIRYMKGEKFVQLESNFKTTPGPDYYVYATTASDVQDFDDFQMSTIAIELGKLEKGAGASFYKIPSAVDVELNSIVIICKRFQVFITAATIK